MDLKIFRLVLMGCEVYTFSEQAVAADIASIGFFGLSDLLYAWEIEFPPSMDDIGKLERAVIAALNIYGHHIL